LRVIPFGAADHQGWQWISESGKGLVNRPSKVGLSTA